VVDEGQTPAERLAKQRKNLAKRCAGLSARLKPIGRTVAFVSNLYESH
jgi:hypothetical protein